MKRIFFVIIIFLPVVMYSQNYEKEYEDFSKTAKSDYHSFRDDCNRKYADFLRTAWEWYEGKVPIPLPKELSPVPLSPYRNNGKENAVEVVPIEVLHPVKPAPQPKPVAPVREMPDDEDYFNFDLWGITCSVRLPVTASIGIDNCDPELLADGWQHLSKVNLNNAIRDCLEIRIRYGLCDWAYLCFLDKLCKEFTADRNGGTLLMAYLYCQSGYQMRLGVDGNILRMLFSSHYQIYNQGYFEINGLYFYPWGGSSDLLKICAATFEGETPMTLEISKDIILGGEMSDERIIKSDGYEDIRAVSHVPISLINFYSSYPSASINGDPMTRWALYANTPLAQKTRELLYPDLKKKIDRLSQCEAVDRLLNLVQTGLEYEYDDTVWGYDRAFFAEESLYYPFCDCEDRSILFSRLVRDLLGLDVALVYYPGHLATAVHFTEDVGGDSILIEGRKFIVCDPTYIGAPVGSQMPDLDYNKIRVFVL